MQTHTTTATLTDAQIHRFILEALAAGDVEAAKIARRAAGCGPRAKCRRQVAAWIAEAEAQARDLDPQVQLNRH